MESDEFDRQEAERAKVVEKAASAALKAISRGARTHTAEERAFLQLAVVERLLRGVRLEAMSMMMRQEMDK